MTVNLDTSNTFATATQTTSAAATEDSSTAISSDFETFLNMLTTQLENQDPLDPVKSDEFAVQLATFSSVEQQVLTNDLLESMTAQLGLSGIGQYASWVGMEARAAVPARYDGSPLTVVPTPDTGAESAFLVVENNAGQVVQRLQIPTTGEAMEWSGQLANGQAANGVYTFKTESVTNGLVSNTSTAEVYTPVTEARFVNGDTVLVTAGGGEVQASSVTALRDPQ